MTTIFDRPWYKKNDFENDNIIESKYSSFIYNKEAIDRIMKDNNSIIEELYNIANSLVVENPIVLYMSNKDVSYTDGHHIVIANKESFSDINDNHSKFDILIGLTLHESAHCIYSEFELKSFERVSRSKICKHICNIIEDQLIEEKLSIDYPGYRKFINKIKYYYFDKHHKKYDFSVNELDIILKIFLETIRYHKYLYKELNKSIYEKYNELFTKIYDILRKNKCLYDIDENKNLFYNINKVSRYSCASALEICDLLKIEIPDIDEKYDECLKNENSAINEHLKSIDDMSSVYECNDKEDIQNYKKKLGKALSDSIKNNLKEGNINFTNNFNICGNEAAYNNIYSQVRSYIDIAKSIIIPDKFKEINVKKEFQRRGQLNSRQIVSALIGDKLVYNQTKTVNSSIKEETNLNVVLLLDESGSIDEANLHNYISKIAIILYEAISSFKKISLYVYGYGDFLIRYIDKEKTNKYVLGNRMHQHSQNEYEAFNYILNKVKSESTNNTLFIHITDSIYPSSAKLVNIIKENKDTVNFNLVCLSKTMQNKEFNKELYGDDGYVVVDNFSNNNLKNIITQLALIVRKNYNVTK